MQVLNAITKIQAPYAILVKGGAAAYWYIFHLTGREIPLKDIDLVLNNPSLNNSQIAQDFTDRLNELLPCTTSTTFL
ncbi:Hypothetical protein BRZCDTV_356 [Brazilian cedratvirus IHUMI]|uniref:ERV/ALR sulfhydryl oxidase domain-containing protein n=1 Tax=Brazilian cedratvirus IHUMI TaxID=2126980 RepID=A0A2R8FEM9_9VIRU|nr:Hypothetical protein BRZCDTV_356 [Brazilian cedratvirus IHUMI]